MNYRVNILNEKKKDLNEKRLIEIIIFLMKIFICHFINQLY